MRCARASTRGPMTLYVGFDPTADSLHVGNLVPLLLLRRFQLAGHLPIALAGGATGMIGDPGGRSEERNLLDGETLDRNTRRSRRQLSAFLDFEPGPVGQARLVDNRDWTAPMGVLDFLRDVGKHVTVNYMLAKESVKSRVASEHGISFTEFSYMLLQANDYHWLHEQHGLRAAGRRLRPVGQHHGGHRSRPPAQRRRPCTGSPCRSSRARTARSSARASTARSGSIPSARRPTRSTSTS